MVLDTPSAVIDALGGTAAVARLTKRSQQSVTNWRAAGRLPPTTFELLLAELHVRGFDAPHSLWSMEPPQEHVAAKNGKQVGSCNNL